MNSDLFQLKVSMMERYLELYEKAEEYQERANTLERSYMQMTCLLIGSDLFDKSAAWAERSTGIEL